MPDPNGDPYDYEPGGREFNDSVLESFMEGVADGFEKFMSFVNDKLDDFLDAAKQEAYDEGFVEGESGRSPDYFTDRPYDHGD